MARDPVFQSWAVTERTDHETPAIWSRTSGQYREQIRLVDHRQEAKPLTLTLAQVRIQAGQQGEHFDCLAISRRTTPG